MTERREVVLGHPISLSCESNAIPPPRLSWYREGRKLSTADGVVLLPGERGTMASRSSSMISNRYNDQYGSTAASAPL